MDATSMIRGVCGGGLAAWGGLGGGGGDTGEREAAYIKGKPARALRSMNRANLVCIARYRACDYTTQHPSPTISIAK